MSESRAPLIVRLHNWIGDVVVGLPALQLLADHGVPLQLVGRSWAGPLLAGHGWPVQALPKGLVPRVATWRGLKRARSRRGSVDALLLATSFSAALECRLAGLRPMGYDTDHRRWLLGRALPRPTGCHALEEYWRLACAFIDADPAPPAAIGLVLAPSAERHAAELLTGAGIDGAFTVLCPFAVGTLAGQSKRWPGFAALAAALAADRRTVVLCPGPGEAPAARLDFPSATVLDAVPLDSYGALMRRASAVVANDTGPGHLAAAVGARLFSVLGPTDAARWAPWGPTVRVLQKRSGWPSPEAVLAALERQATARHAA